MSHYAKVLPDRLKVNAFYTMDRDIVVAETQCTSHKHFEMLPSAIEIEGQELGKSAWNSDRCVAYYRSDRVVAKCICGDPKCVFGATSS